MTPTIQSIDVEANQSTRKKRVLVVDDEPRYVQLIQKHLEGAGHEVRTATNGEDALKLIKDNHPDLIVSDVMMPKMDGFELLFMLRQKACIDTIPVLMLIMFAQDAEVFKGWQQGLDCCLKKPFNPLELVSMVGGILNAKTEVE